MRTLLYAFLIAAGCTASAVAAEPSWWCESRWGECFVSKEACLDVDSSCYWKRRAWVATYHDGLAYRAFTNQLSCERFRLAQVRRGLELPTRCIWMKVAAQN